MKLTNEIIENDTLEIINSPYINWSEFSNKAVLVTGANGLIGAKIIETLLNAPQNIKIIALARSKERLENLFFAEIQQGLITPIYQDVTDEITFDENVDYIIHTACGTASKSFVEKPVETIDTIYTGTKNILDFALKKRCKGLLHLSSMEVFGQTDFNKETPLKENELGYLDISQPRSSYPEGKRLAENLCIAYAKEYNVPVKIARLVQILGANVDYNDNRVYVQFARNIVENKDIILHTKGDTERNYCYITDAISGMFVILQRGTNGECYNLANPHTACSIKQMAENLCKKYPTSQLKIDLTNENAKFYLPKVKTILDTQKLEALHWQPQVGLDEMFSRVIKSFQYQTSLVKNI